MSVKEWLNQATARLTSAGIGTATLDCQVLLADILNRDRSWILAHPEHLLPDSTLVKLNTLIEKRKQHIPLAYIRGKSEFYGREFLINSNVLEPRPESETMIDMLRTQDIAEQTTIIDVGTGSGALAITAKILFPKPKIIATDIDEKCLDVAVSNAEKHQANIDFVQTNLIEGLRIDSESVLIILANLPYVPDNYQINQAAAMEPKLAIFGGADGLDLYRKLFQQLSRLSNSNIIILSESLPPQHKNLSKVAEKYKFCLKSSEDFIQRFDRIYL